MATQVEGDPLAASPAAADTVAAETLKTADGGPAASPVAGEEVDGSPPPEPEAAFNAAADKAEGIKPEDKVEGTEAAEVDPDEPKGEDAEHAEEDPEGKVEPEAIPPEQEEQLTKAFADRPEWHAALKLVAPGKEKEMRAAMRPIFARETQLVTQLTQLKPARDFHREALESVHGNETGFNNIRFLIKALRTDADPEDAARAIPLLNQLLDAAQTQAGAKLTSPDLVTEARQLDQDVADFKVKPEDAAKRKAELLELQRSRTVTERTRTMTEQQRQAAEQQRLEAEDRKVLDEIQKAVDPWEAKVKKSDPDYPIIRDLVIDRMRVLAEARTKELGRALSGPEAVEVCNVALKQIKARAAKLKPTPRAIQPVTGGSSAHGARQQPQNAREAFEDRINRLEGRG